MLRRPIRCLATLVIAGSLWVLSAPVKAVEPPQWGVLTAEEASTADRLLQDYLMGELRKEFDARRAEMAT